MIRDRSPSSSKVALAKITMYFHQWATKWHYGNAKEDTTRRPDLPTIICLLQSIGFKLREFERKHNGNDDNYRDDEATTNGSVKITMECGTSGIKAVLDMNEIACACHDNAEVNEGSIWNVTGTGPTDKNQSQKKFEETGSNLLPELSKESMTAIQSIVHRIIKFIDAKGEIDSSEFKAENVRQSGDVVTATSSTSGVELERASFARSTSDLYKQIDDEQQQQPRANSRENSTRKMSDVTNLRSCGSSQQTITIDENKPQPGKLRRQKTYELLDDRDDDDEKIFSSNDNLLNYHDESSDEPRLPLMVNKSSSLAHRLLNDSFGEVSQVRSSDNEKKLEEARLDDDLFDCVIRAHLILQSAVKLVKKREQKSVTLNSSLKLGGETVSAKKALYEVTASNKASSTTANNSPFSRRVTTTRIASDKNNRRASLAARSSPKKSSAIVKSSQYNSPRSSSALQRKSCGTTSRNSVNSLGILTRRLSLDEKRKRSPLSSRKINLNNSAQRSPIVYPKTPIRGKRVNSLTNVSPAKRLISSDSSTTPNGPKSSIIKPPPSGWFNSLPRTGSKIGILKK